jgi:SAM-dependent methyltransferase
MRGLKLFGLANEEAQQKRWRSLKRRRLAAWLSGNGIEIGALCRPLEVPANAYVRYVDRMQVPELRHHYPELADLPLVQVDIIGSAEDLSAVPSDSVDFVIANHLLEHMQYPIRALQSFMRVLRPGGILYMALPDARAGIDRDRELTTIEHLLDEHRNGAERNRESHYRDWCGNAEKRDDVDAFVKWEMEMDYSIHFHVWRSDTFLDFLSVVRRDAELQFEVLSFAAPEYPGDDEFIVILAKGVSPYPQIPPTPPTSTQRLRQSRVAPVLRPPYRVAKRVGSRVRSLAGHVRGAVADELA